MSLFIFDTLHKIFDIFLKIIYSYVPILVNLCHGVQGKNLCFYFKMDIRKFWMGVHFLYFILVYVLL